MTTAAKFTRLAAVLVGVFTLVLAFQVLFPTTATADFGALSAAAPSPTPAPPTPARSATRASATPAKLAPPTVTLATTAPQLVVLKAANLRGGPGTHYPIVGAARPNQVFGVVARYGSWFQVQSGKATAWLAGSLARANALAQAAPVARQVPPAPAPVKRATPARPAPAPLPALVVLGPDTQYPVRATTVRGWGYEFIDESAQYDIVLYRDVWGALNKEIAAAKNNGQINYDAVTRIVLVDAQPHPDPACAGWGWAPDRNTYIEQYTPGRNPCLVQHSLWPLGDGSGAGLLVGAHYDGRTVAVAAYGPTGADWSTTYFAEQLSRPAAVGPADRPDFTLPLYAPLGRAVKVDGRWTWTDPFVQIVPAQVASTGTAYVPPPAPAPAPVAPQSAAAGRIVFTRGNAVAVLDVASGQITTLAANARQADLAPDGRLVYYRPGGNILQGQGEQFGLHPEERAPAFLAGGEVIVHGNLGGGDRLYLYRVARQEPQALEANSWEGRQPLLARYPLAGPGGQLVATACDAWERGSACGVWSLTSPDGATWRGIAQLSPDPNARPSAVVGDRVLWASAEPGNWDVYAGWFAGGKAQNLTNTPSQDWGATLSPDGQWLAFMSDRAGPGLYLAHADGANARLLLAVPEGFGPAPYTERLVWR